jgi:hypothetical protein
MVVGTGVGVGVGVGVGEGVGVGVGIGHFTNRPRLSRQTFAENTCAPIGFGWTVNASDIERAPTEAARVYSNFIGD